MSENVSRYKIQDTLKVSKIRIRILVSNIIPSTAVNKVACYNCLVTTGNQSVNRLYTLPQSSQSSVTEALRPTRRRSRKRRHEVSGQLPNAMFARQPAAEGLGDEGPGRRSRWIAGLTWVTRTSGSCRHSEADDVDDNSLVASRGVYRMSVYQRERKTVHQCLTHRVQSAGRSPT